MKEGCFYSFTKEVEDVELQGVRAARGAAEEDREGATPSVNSDQSELELDDARLRIPWDGRSPRSLIKCGKLFILKELPTGGPIRSDPLQYTLFLKGSPS